MSEQTEIKVSGLIHPLMQATDIDHLYVNIYQVLLLDSA